MSDMTRRQFLVAGGAFLSVAAEAEILAGTAAAAEVGVVDPIAREVYFHEGDLMGKAVCNNGWVILEDYVLVIDANFPSGAQEILPKIRALTEKPIRFAFDTHHHGDHAYGNQIFVEHGAVPVAHTGVIEEMKRYETGYYDSKPGRWEEAAKERPDVKASKLKPPSVLFPNELIFDDGKRRVELMHLGVAHTHGDAWAWLPKERILFGGDACCNGPYNFVGDGNVEQWIKTLDAAKKLGARILCPGHGPRGSGMVVEDQQAFFKALWDAVGMMLSKKTPAEARDMVGQVKTALQGDARIARYVGDFFPAQAEKVYTEQTGKAFPPAPKSARNARVWHAHAHGRFAPQ